MNVDEAESSCVPPGLADGLVPEIVIREVVAVPVVAPAAVSVPPVAPPPLPARAVSTAPARVLPDPEPDPLFARLRDLGLLPPADLAAVKGLLVVDEAFIDFLPQEMSLASALPPRTVVK